MKREALLIGINDSPSDWNQQWKVHPMEDGTFRIDNRESGKSLDRDRRSPFQGLVQYDWHGAPNQRWHFHPAEK